jgi:hypothetical protein
MKFKIRMLTKKIFFEQRSSAAIAMKMEVLISIMNTPDVVDAVYGTAGVIFTIAVMYVFNKVGIRPSNEN